MFDDDGGGRGFSRWGWFQLGQMASESDQTFARTSNLVKDIIYGNRPVTVDQSYIDQLINHIRINDGEVQKANNTIRAYMADVNSWKNRANQWETYAVRLEEELERVKRSEQSAQQSSERRYSALQRQRNAVANLRYFASHLQRFAALGLANEPEYEQLAIRQQAAWTNFISDPTLTEIGDAVKTLVDALDRKVPR